ncbi:MAG: hypothetical protein HYZ75_04500 [Elusimicrobia bacterium]|nr:hypothetical protein [Elusimicrobiota bacterium]
MTAFLLIAMAAIIPAAHAEEKSDGNALLRNCTSAVRELDKEVLKTQEGLDAVHCIGYLNGFTDSHSVDSIAKPQKPLYCLPVDGLETGQVARIVVKYLKGRPEILHQSARILTALALTHAFPCEKAAGKPGKKE